MTFKIGVLGLAYNTDYTSRSMRPARPDNMWQWRNIWGSILFVLQIVDIKYYLNLARSTKKFTEMFQKLRPKLQLLVGREKKCMFQLFRLSFIFVVLFFQ